MAGLFAATRFVWLSALYPSLTLEFIVGWHVGICLVFLVVLLVVLVATSVRGGATPLATPFIAPFCLVVWLVVVAGLVGRFTSLGGGGLFLVVLVYQFATSVEASLHRLPRGVVGGGVDVPS
ncbi:hypothetical protein DU484_06180 [Haloplanus rubicundus]|uniref:Uncharacterized protein n=1 Tax=Haloplanus rubicundus TaxID=1547898 RepID=A0A345EBB6_9EURY|nr:hypothetical protein DU484_06180 [Haloplanus rubicundus]